MEAAISLLTVITNINRSPSTRRTMARCADRIRRSDKPDGGLIYTPPALCTQYDIAKAHDDCILREMMRQGEIRSGRGGRVSHRKPINVLPSSFFFVFFLMINNL